MNTCMKIPAHDGCRDLMPKSLREIADRIGLDATLALVGRFGGTSVYVPRKLDASHPLCEALGLEAARRLVEEYGRIDLNVPKAQAYWLRRRHAAIRRKHSEGARINELALTYGYTARYVRNIVRNEQDAQAA
jgi:Mor transcription activator family protein